MIVTNRIFNLFCFERSGSVPLNELLYTSLLVNSLFQLMFIKNVHCNETNRTVKLTMFESDRGREPVNPHSERKSMLSFSSFPMSVGIGPCMFGFEDSVLFLLCMNRLLFVNKGIFKTCQAQTVAKGL